LIVNFCFIKVDKKVSVFVSSNRHGMA